MEKIVMPASSAGDLRTRQVDPGDAAAVRRFIEFPFELYRHAPRWTPPLRLEMRQLMDPRRNAFFRHSQAGFFTVERGGHVVGRIAALRQRFYNEKHQNDTAFFHWFECIDDEAVAHALFRAAEEWARERGCRRMLGPIGFIQPDPPGILVEGFEHDGTMNVPWHFPYYERLVTSAGFVPHTDYISGYVDRSHPYPAEMMAHADAARAKWGYSVKTFQTKKEIWAWSERFFQTYLEAFSEVPDFYPMSPPEFELLATNMIQVAEPRTIELVMRGDEIIGFLLSFRDVTAGFKRAQGNLLPLGWWHLLRSLQTSQQLNIIALGVLPKHQKGGANLTLFAELVRTFFASRFQRAEIVQIVRSNLNTYGDMTRLGATWDKCHRVFRRPFDQATATVPEAP